MKEKNKNYAAVGSLVRDALARFGMQQTELAKRIGITPPSLNMMLSGVSALPLRRFYQIAGILNFTQDEIDKAKEIYRNRLMLSPEQAEQFFVNPSDLNNKQGVSTMGETQFDGTENSQPKNTVTVIYRAEILGKTFEVYGTAENPLFLAKDVAEWIEHSNHRSMLDSVDEDEKVKHALPVNNPYGGYQVEDQWFLTEDGLYEVLMLSRKPIAKPFKKQVKQILHEVRTKGGYMVSRPDDTPEMIMARALKVADETIKRRERELAEAKQEISVKTEALAVAAPKAAFVDNFCVSQGTILVRDFAKHIAQALELKGFGEKVMFQYLKDNDYLNLNRYPTQRSTDMGLFKVSEGIHQFSDGSTGLHHCSRITCKGQTYFYNKLKEKYETEGRWW